MNIFLRYKIKRAEKKRKQILTKSYICKLIGIPFKGEDEQYTALTYAKSAIPGSLAAICLERKTPYAGLTLKRENELADLAMLRGARALLTTRQIKKYPCIIVQGHVTDGIKTIMREFRKSLDMKAIEITGSYGKSTVTNMLESVFSSNYNALGHRGDSLNMFYHTVGRLQSAAPTVDLFLQEAAEAPHYGVPGDISEIVMPDIGIITSVGTSHIERMGSKEAILESSMSIARGIKSNGVLILNGDDSLLADVYTNKNVVYYGITNENVDYKVSDFKQTIDGISFSIEHKDESVPVKMSCVGKHNAQNAAAAFAAAKCLGMKNEEIVYGLSLYRPEGVRQRLLSDKGYNFYLDCYNASVETMITSIDTVCNLELPNCGGHRIAVLGDIKQAGDNSEEYHRQIGRHVRGSSIDTLICIGEDACFIADEAKGREGLMVHIAESHDEIVRYLKANTTSSDIIMIKGSNSMRLWEIPGTLIGVDLDPNTGH